MISNICYLKRTNAAFAAQAGPDHRLISDEILNRRLSSRRGNSSGAFFNRVNINDKINAGKRTIPTNPTSKVNILLIPPRTMDSAITMTSEERRHEITLQFSCHHSAKAAILPIKILDHINSRY